MSDAYREMYDPERQSSYKSLAEAYQQIQENPLDILKRQADRYKRAAQAIYRDLPQAVMQAGADAESGLTGNNASANERERQRRLNDPRLRAVDRATDQQGLQPFGGQARMTPGEEDARTSIPRTDPQGNRIFTDKDRPTGFHTIKKDGQDIRRYWDGKQWLVDKPGFRMGAETPSDPGAQAIRRSENPLNAVPKVFGMQRGSDNPLDTIGDQAGKAWKWMTGQGSGPRDIQGTEDPLKLGDKTGLRPQNAGQSPGKSGVDDFNAATQDIRREPGTFDSTGVDKTTVAGDSPPSAPPSAPSQNLTPMQQWAKNFPQLAAKVKPGQAGYDEIQKMNKPASTPTPAATPVRTAVRQAIQTPKVNVPKLNNSTPSNVSSQFKSPKPLINMNTIRTEETEIIQSLLAEGLELQEAEDTIVMAYLLMNNMVTDEESARVVVTHMSEEAKSQIILDEDWAKKAGEFVRNFGQSIWRGGQGKTINPDANPVHRAANAAVRGAKDTVSSFAKGVSGSDNKVTSGSESSSTSSKPESAKPESAKPESAKPESAKPTPPKAETKSPPKTETKSTGSGRLDSALKWASDPKNKDAWMKEHKTQHEVYSSIADAYNSINETKEMGKKRTPEEQAEFDKALAPYKKAREDQKKQRENAPGAEGIDWRRGEHHIGDYMRKDKKDRMPKA